MLTAILYAVKCLEFSKSSWMERKRLTGSIKLLCQKRRFPLGGGNDRNEAGTTNQKKCYYSRVCQRVLEI